MICVTLLVSLLLRTRLNSKFPEAVFQVVVDPADLFFAVSAERSLLSPTTTPRQF